MKSNLAVAHAVTPSLLEQPTHTESDSSTKLDLCRDIIDDMMDRGLLGFLLSSTHLRKYLAAYSTYAAKPKAEILRRSLTNVEVMDEIHTKMIDMYKGLYIAEARIANATELMAYLDDLYLDFSSSIDLIDVRYETSLQQLETVEMAWRYRSACGRGTQIGGR